MADTMSSWAVGCITLTSSATIVVGGSNVVIPAGTYYLRDAKPELSLVDMIETGIAGVHAGSTVRILKNRKVVIDLNGNSATLTIPIALQQALGFTSSPYAAATSHTAENVSYLLWSAGWPETTTNSPVGVAGRKRYDRVMTSSPSGQTFHVTVHHSVTMLDLSWKFVRPERSWSPAEAPGEYSVFFERVIVPGMRFKLYSQMAEDDNSTSPVTWSTSVFGPYVVPTPDYDWYQRAVASTDSLGSSVSIEAMKTSEVG